MPAIDGQKWLMDTICCSVFKMCFKSQRFQVNVMNQKDVVALIEKRIRNTLRNGQNPFLTYEHSGSEMNGIPG